MKNIETLNFFKRKRYIELKNQKKKNNFFQNIKSNEKYLGEKNIKTFLLNFSKGETISNLKIKKKKRKKRRRFF